MHPPHPFGGPLIGPQPHPRLDKGPVQAEIDLGNPCHGRKLALVLFAVSAQGADIIESTLLEADKIVAADQIGGPIAGLLRKSSPPRKDQAAARR